MNLDVATYVLCTYHKLVGHIVLYVCSFLDKFECDNHYATVNYSVKCAF